jgi:hypothetical protein
VKPSDWFGSWAVRVVVIMLVRMMVMAAKSVAFTCGRCGLLHWFICGLTKKGVRIKVQQFLVLGNFSA